MPKKKSPTLTDQLHLALQECDKLRDLVASYRSSACVAETEVIRLQLQIKNHQHEASGLRDQNFKLVERITELLHQQQLKES